MSQSLFERLGGIAGITNIASDLIDNDVAKKRLPHTLLKAIFQK